MTVRLRVERGGGERHLLHTVSTFTDAMGIANACCRVRAGARARSECSAWSGRPYALGAAARVTQPLSAST